MLYFGQVYMHKLQSSHILPNTPGSIQAAVNVLKEGKLVGIPTDTIYGLAAIMEEASIQRLFIAKGRPVEKAVPILLADTEDISTYAIDISDAAWKLIRRLMPGGLTIVLRKAPTVPDIVTGGKDTVAVRIPDHEVPRSIVRKLGRPITGTSANRSGMPALTTAEAVHSELGEHVEMVIDGGPSTSQVPSTIVDLSDDPPRILRLGFVTRRRLEDVLGHPISDAL